MEDFVKAVREIIRSNKYLGIEDQKEQKAHVIYMAYKVMHDLYEILIDEEEIDLPWDEFLDYVASASEIVFAASKVVRGTIMEYPSTSRFNFKNPDLSMLAELEEYETLRGYQLYSDKEAYALVEYHFMMAETAYFFRLRIQKGYTWDQYTEELEKNGDTWKTLLFAFRESILKMDFKPGWRKMASMDSLGEPMYDMEVLAKNRLLWYKRYDPALPWLGPPNGERSSAKIVAPRFLSYRLKLSQPRRFSNGKEEKTEEGPKKQRLF